MLIKNGDSYIGGPLDAIVVLHDVTKNTFHAAFFEEAPMPGPVGEVEAVPIVRLKSKMHRTEGAATLAEALEHLDSLTNKIELPESNVARDKAIPWNGELGIIFIVRNWRAEKVNVGDVLVAR